METARAAFVTGLLSVIYIVSVTLLASLRAGHLTPPSLAEASIVIVGLFLVAVSHKYVRMGVALMGYAFLCYVLPPSGTLRVDWNADNVIRLVAFTLLMLVFAIYLAGKARTNCRVHRVESGDSFLS